MSYEGKEVAGSYHDMWGGADARERQIAGL